MTAPAGRRRSFEAQLLAFGRDLRSHGLLIGPLEVALGLEALELSDTSEREEVRLALRTVFAKSPAEGHLFDRLFERFWGGPQRDTPFDMAATLPQPQGANPSLVDWKNSDDDEERHDTARYSPAERLAGRDFAQASPEEVRDLRRQVARLARLLATRFARRLRRAERRGERLDVRRTMRRSLGRGGEPFELLTYRRRRERTRLLFLFDVSGSMAIYSRFLLELAYAFVREPAVGRVEAFGFATDLYRLTGVLRDAGVARALLAAQLAMLWRRGGTRIGASLDRFLERYDALLAADTVTVIASGGWDTGDLELLTRSLRTLRARGGRLIWLNPLAGSPGYQPTAAGIRAALPHLDVFAAAHNLESLRGLEKELIKG